jgi:hypothetical protein
MRVQGDAADMDKPSEPASSLRAIRSALRGFRLQPEGDNFRLKAEAPSRAEATRRMSSSNSVECRRARRVGDARNVSDCHASCARTGDDETTHGDGSRAADDGPDRLTAGAAESTAAAAAIDRRPHERDEEARRLLPAVLGRAHRIDVPRDLPLGLRLPLRQRPVRWPRLERHRPRPRPGRRQPHRALRAGRAARHARAAEPEFPIEQQESR